MLPLELMSYPAKSWQSIGEEASGSKSLNVIRQSPSAKPIIFFTIDLVNIQNSRRFKTVTQDFQWVQTNLDK